MVEPVESSRRPGSAPTTPSIAILGAGVAGLCMAIRLKQAGIHSFTIYEKSNQVGGTWRDNTYPGAGCDVPSHLYSFSFEPKFDWSRLFSLQPEIQRYLEHCVGKYDLQPHIRFGVEIAAVRFDEDAAVWRLRTTAGEEVRATVVVSGTGQLNRPHVPTIPGLDEFAGTWFHSARWRHDHECAGGRVAVIGNGASAIQFIPPVAQTAKRLTIFQRTANWVIPRNDRAYRPWEQWAFRHVPGFARFHRALIYWRFEMRFFGFFKNSWFGRKMEQHASEYMASHITDRALQDVLTPDYPAGCKRILISDDYYQALAQPNVDVVTEPIARITREGVVTADGSVHPADTIVFATGFETTTFLAPIEFEGLGGRRLSESWKDGAEAYLGVAVSGFPNLFLLYGPNTNLGHNSIIFMIECQVRYVLQCIERLRRGRLAYLDVKPHVQRHFNTALQRRIKNTAWDAGCTSWYKTASGKVTNNWSGFTVEYWWRTRRPDQAAFTEVPATARVSAQPAAA
jgi:cation diffusion facilitator CzcD-associated flavoprotein CzcO